ncbi:inorganic phosphate transporter [Geofilum rubicundum]|uniref:Phosphate transporter n=1 Tax=Geofilum rubicundum JCM 15548 TaxID=1236989 RepID=A0A0E9M2S5_9BACT|nr:inorganic phosphate transporter [Geofilum rubicundum]GAO31839.1 probable low-affinity inorganic phosphate transporter [Geofilum rubicundum JCM 15548]
MENIYLILVLVLFLLAISDLVVGVSNDAVNFLNSAIGAKAAPFKIIMLVAALGVFVGATFSSGMMEIARKSMFNPEHFYFQEIMIIFLAVMITDVVLLDLFNTFGLPTSTTVSIIFELLGAAVGVSIIKVMNDPAIPMSEYINSAKALAIISGILISVVISFSIGAIVQYITRAIFSFRYQNRIKYLGSLWGGIAITAITYFILVKGANGSSFMTAETKAWINNNSNLIILYSLLGWISILQIFHWVFKLNILKFTVLAGTFALAMAFAGNDLVNFIGVPLAGFEAFRDYISTPGATPTSLLMGSLAEPVKTETYILLIAGLIMVVTLWTSKKARKVVKTSVDLSRQGEGDERFGSSYFARSLVRGSIALSKSVGKFIPAPVQKYLDKQFEMDEVSSSVKEKDAPSFDMLRASVNLVVASILIASATSLKLPLSTTYVTFMVAMGTSLSDRAWGRDSAVYRITGVLSVIGGWFFTAFSAFTVAFLVALFISYAGTWSIFLLIALAIFFLIRTHIFSNKATKEQLSSQEIEIEEVNGEIISEKVLEQCKTNVSDVLTQVSGLYMKSLISFEAEDRKQLKEAVKEVDSLNKRTKKMKTNIYKTVRKLQEESIDSSLYYVQVLDYLRETAHCLTFITSPCWEHLDNNHKTFSEEQFHDLNLLQVKVKTIINKSVGFIEGNNLDQLDIIYEDQVKILEHLRTLRKIQLKRIKKDKAGTKISMLYLAILHETQNMMLHLINLIKAQRDFANYIK